ncbi:unnamed protein product [Bathycoccus prasinos]
MHLAAGERAKTKTKSENDYCFRRRNRQHHPLLEYARRRKKRLGDAHFHHHHHHSLEKKLEEFLHPYETLGIDANAITAKYAGEMFLNYCANFCQEKEKEKKKRRKSSDVIVILSNNNDEKTGNGDTTLRRRRSASQNTTIEILSSLETGDSQKKRLRVDDSDDDDDAKAFWNRRILTTPPMSPINKQPVLFSSNVNTPEKASESKSNAVVNKNDADTIRRGPTKRIPKTTTTIQTTEETNRARLDLLAIAHKEEKKADDFARKSRVNCIKSKRLAKKKWSIYDSQRRRKRSLDAILATSNSLLFS